MLRGAGADAGNGGAAQVKTCQPKQGHDERDRHKDKLSPGGERCARLSPGQTRNVAGLEERITHRANVRGERRGGAAADV